MMEKDDFLTTNYTQRVRVNVGVVDQKETLEIKKRDAVFFFLVGIVDSLRKSFLKKFDAP